MDIVWMPASKRLLPAQYQSEFLTFLQYQNIYKVQNILIDERMFKFKVEPELQKWIIVMIMERMISIAQKVAILSNEDPVRDRTIKSTVEKSKLFQLQLAFFKDKNAAKDFLTKE
ncbi:hypothetical protein [Chondrinema litorale]|uniref:hypothetical protein n=1 Tax=Chondrinema litorale TaxID=2994555 RepID=UPI0025430178|nr:hypothetical protein [Chondrinema litorale]UZR97202.1 hypothetical protein OQ292_25215 [Chondrinema litorale]